MANKVQNTEADVMVEAKGKLELFFDKWGNKILYALVVIGVVIGAFFIVRNFIDRKHEGKEQAASVAMANAATAEAYAAVADDYAGTAAGNTSAYMAGAEYLKAGDLANAQKYLEMYKDTEGAAGELINAQAYGLRGDLAVEQNDLQSALAMFAKAVEASDDAFTYATFMHKSALVHQAMGNDAEAQQCYKDIVAKYPQTESQYGRYIKE